jgi:hypothetical protein
MVRGKQSPGEAAIEALPALGTVSGTVIPMTIAAWVGPSNEKQASAASNVDATRPNLR